AGRIAASRGLATFSNLEMQHSPKIFCIFLQKVLAKNRLGELRALTTADFDFDTNMLSITKSYQRIKGEDIITKPKTKRSIRKVIMPETVANEMKDFIDSIYGITPDDRLFPVSKSYLHHEMDRGVKESGVKRIRVHDLRHSHVSLSQGYFEPVKKTL
ncbi:tyrosine-type recombinase/integrase, partial [Mediterraneibacter faecis]|uniref:tyrosine-type recombinase/integrase n=1 Tax=Mediterraneibacter faecis TaxID=592978 RepID=UPI003F8A6CD3